jgi:hypothetical protein
MSTIPYLSSGDGAAPFGIMTARDIGSGVPDLAARVKRIYDQADVLTTPRATLAAYAVLEGTVENPGQFGVIASGTPGEQGEKFWNALGSVNTFVQSAVTFAKLIDNGG